MLPDTLGLNERQRALVEALLSGMPVNDAGRFAGYESSGSTYNSLQSVKVRTALREGLLRRMASDAPMAWRIVVDIAHDKDTDKKTRLAAAKDILDRTGFVPPKAENASVERALEDMSRDELLSLVQRGEDRLAGMARPVNTSDDAAADKQLTDMLE